MSKEIEYKALISKEEYEHLLSEISNHFSYRNYVQTNYYYDTEKLSLYHRHETLRIRKKDESLQLEYKFNKEFVKHARICEEKSYPMNIIPQKLSKDDIRRCGLPDCNYFLLGSLVTNRSDFVLSEGVLSLDKNEYLGYVDYEVEFEFTSLSLQMENQFLELINFNEKTLTPGKYSRFINEIRYDKLRKLKMDKK